MQFSGEERVQATRAVLAASIDAQEKMIPDFNFIIMWASNRGGLNCLLSSA